MLLAHGKLAPTTLLRALIEQLEARFAELGSWADGNLWFLRDTQSGEEPPRGVKSALSLVVRAVREGYSAEEVAQYVAPARKLRLYRGRAGAVDFVRLGLDEAERHVVRSAPGASSLEALVEELERSGVASVATALRAVFIGLSAGLLVSPAWH
jgi:hypothetical protein